MTNLSRHPILRAIYDASQAVEKCGASVELTDAVMSVTALYPLAEDLLDRIATLEAELVKEQAISACCQQWDTCSGVRCIPLSEHWKARATTLEAERDEARRENDVLRGLLGNSAKDCPYCGLPAERQAECPSGFPGCSRADDQQLSKHFADAYRAESAESALAEARKELRKLARHLASAWFYGGWKAQTYNERMMEDAMRSIGWWPFDDEDQLIAAIDSAIEAEKGDTNVRD